MQKIIQLELNEVNFEFAQAYMAQGHLPNLNELLGRHGLTRTSSEAAYEHLEPWIQWVTAHTGQTYHDHKVFRLGDIRGRGDLEQIWEVLEARGLRVGAMSPMNAANRCRDAAFFVPDPWTGGEVVGSKLLGKLYETVSQLVNDNAQARVSRSSVGWLIASLAYYAQPANYAHLFHLVTTALRHRWARALVLDALLADAFIAECRRTGPDYASLFLNAAAHLQHHHLFDAAVYRGPHHNPSWYRDGGGDPILKVYALYDRILGQIRGAFPDHRLIIATGLHQIPYEQALYYWRLRDHATFLRSAGIVFERVEPRMSRDFLVACKNVDDARRAEETLQAAVADDGEALFEIDNRGENLFAMLRYPHDLPPGLGYSIGGRSLPSLRDHCAFVAIKNGDHDGIGYLIDTATTARAGAPTIPLTELFNRTISHFDRAMAA